MYKLTHTDTILRITDGASIPSDTNNSDYREYLKWRDGYTDAEGMVYEPNTPEPADPLPEPIYTASAASFRRALRRLGLRDAVEAGIAASGDGELIDMWEYETTLHSNNSHLVAFAASHGLVDQITEVFLLADSI